MKRIMFNDRYGLTAAVLNGRKTQTRRIVSDKLWDEWYDYDDYCNNVGISGLAEIGIIVTREYYDEKKFFLDNTPYKVGEVVAVAQSYKDCTDDCIKNTWLDVTVKSHLAKEAGYKNKMFVRADFMPHRIRITNVRVERLQDISDEDCIKEGIRDYSTPNEKRFGFSDFKREDIFCFKSPREAYAALMDYISGKGSFDSNPYVFVYDFELVK